MNITAESLRSVFSRNRTEEIGEDVWEDFVIPRFFDRLATKSAMKPLIFFGGRGCGKTMLLRYLSHDSQFSPKRATVAETDLQRIGLYWRADTQFATTMLKRGIEDDIWESAFKHLAALTIGAELLRSLRSIARSKSAAFDDKFLEGFDLSIVAAYDPSLPTVVESLQHALDVRLAQFETWVNNVRSQPVPLFLPGDKFVRAIINEIRNKIPALKHSVFFVYLDEYENLTPFQRVLINTWLKHSVAPLIFNLAMKQSGRLARRTTFLESIAGIHDYNWYDVDELLDDEFEVFTAELLFSKLALADLVISPVKQSVLRDPLQLETRRVADYKKAIVAKAISLFPEVSRAEHAKLVLQDPPLRRRLVTRVDSALRRRGSTLPPEDFVRDDVPEPSIVAPVLIARRNLRPEDILDEMDRYRRDEPNRFNSEADWLHNYFFASLLFIYEPYSRPCPFYAGFSTFRYLARGSLRHFFELCHKSLLLVSDQLAQDAFPVSVSVQALAAQMTSTALIGEIKSFGPRGNRLHTFVHRLGMLFQIAHQRPTQSEAEQSHFALSSGNEPFNEDDLDFIDEAVKWSVLFEERATKQKSSLDAEAFDYVLNPIYAPFFHISYRKRKKLELSTDEFHVLLNGTFDSVRALYSEYSKRWEVEPEDAAPLLFSDETEHGR